MKAKLRLLGDQKLDRVSVPVASATEIDQYDLISLESNLAVKMDAEAEDATFLGVSESQSKNGETDNISVLRKGVFEVNAEAATYTIGQALMLNNTNQTLEAATANSIAWAYEVKVVGSGGTLKVLIDTVALSKLFAISA